MIGARVLEDCFGFQLDSIINIGGISVKPLLDRLDPLTSYDVQSTGIHLTLMQTARGSYSKSAVKAVMQDASLFARMLCQKFSSDPNESYGLLTGACAMVDPNFTTAGEVDASLVGSRHAEIARRGGLVGGLASVATHGEDLRNGGLVGGLASVATHGEGMRNGGLVGGLASAATHVHGITETNCVRVDVLRVCVVWIPTKRHTSATGADYQSYQLARHTGLPTSTGHAVAPAPVRQICLHRVWNPSMQPHRRAQSEATLKVSSASLANTV